MRKFEYIAIGGGYGFSDPSLVGKRIISLKKSGVGYSKIVTSTPTGKEVQYIISEGSINLPDQFSPREVISILYEDLVTFCLPVAIQSGFVLPDTFAGLPYNASFFIAGTPGFTITPTSIPPWLTVFISEGQVIFSGTPEAGDAGNNTVSFTLSNACGSVPFSQSFNVIIIEVDFIPTTFVSEDRLNKNEIANMKGTPGCVATIECNSYVNTNGGDITVNGNVVTLGYSFTVTVGLDGGNFNCDIIGDADMAGTNINVGFIITSVTVGAIGLSKTYQISKVF